MFTLLQDFALHIDIFGDNREFPKTFEIVRHSPGGRVKRVLLTGTLTINSMVAHRYANCIRYSLYKTDAGEIFTTGYKLPTGK